MMGSNSSESLNGLKFGKKIYFEDVGVGVQAKSGTGSSSAGGLPPPAPAKKKERLVGGVVQGGGQPPRCQVEGCKVDLSDVKAYYSRHKVCIMHSKSQKVVVSGLEQRFCQQCSRFHQLPEFDNGKRSCRRRLAGHNERRRKPPPGSLLSTRFGTYSSSVFENNSGTGGFLMDFTKCPRVTLRDQWSPARASEKVFGNQPPAFEKFIPTPCQSNSESHPPQLQGSVNGTHYHGPGIPSGGCFAGVPSDSSCALSLLSNQPCGSRNQSSSSLGANYLLDTDNNAHMVQPAVTNGANINHFSSSSWGLKGNSETGTTYLNMNRGGCLAQISHPGNSQYTGDLQLTQQRGRQFMVPENSRASYDSSAQQKHWSL